MEHKIYIDGNDLIVNGKVVGSIYGKIYVSHRNESDHLYNNMNGYPITDYGLQLLKERGVLKIKIIEHKKSGKINRYITTLEKYMNGVLIQHKEYEPQRVIPIRLLDKEDENKDEDEEWYKNW